MKTLWVNSNFMHPTTKGGQIRTLEMLRHLHRRHEIHYVAIENPDQPEGPAHAHVRERRLVDGHADRNPAAARAVEDLQPLGLGAADLCERHRRDRVDLVPEQRVHAGDVVVDVNNDQPVEVGLAVPPVMGVPNEL